MISWSDLSASVATAVRERRIGRPVCLRLHVLGLPADADLPALSAELLTDCSRWFDERLERVEYRPTGPHATAVGEGADGAVLLVCLHAQGDGPTRADLWLVGVQGTLHFDVGEALHLPSGEPSPAVHRALLNSHSQHAPAAVPF